MGVKLNCTVCRGLVYRQRLCCGCFFFRRRHGYLPGDPKAIDSLIERRKKRWEVIAATRKKV